MQERERGGTHKLSLQKPPTFPLVGLQHLARLGLPRKSIAPVRSLERQLGLLDRREGVDQGQCGRVEVEVEQEGNLCRREVGGWGEVDHWVRQKDRTTCQLSQLNKAAPGLCPFFRENTR